MAKIIDPSDLADAAVDTTAVAQEVEIQTTARTIELIDGNGVLDNASPGSASGMTMQCLYSFLKEEWKTNTTLNKFKFPLKSYTKNEFLWINGWTPLAGDTRLLLRDAGWEEIGGELYAGMISLGSFDNDADQGYYANVGGLDATSSNFDKTGTVNESIDITSNLTYFKAFLREKAKLYSSYDLLDEQGITTLEPTLYRFPLSNGTDSNVTELVDATIDAYGMDIRYCGHNAPSATSFVTASATTYSTEDVVQDGLGRWAYCTAGGTVTTPGGGWAAFGGTSTWAVYEGEQEIGTGTYYAFDTIVNANSLSKGETYNFTQRSLRNAADINVGTFVDGVQNTYGTVNGNLADDLAAFRGTDLVFELGVFVENYQLGDINSLKFVPIPVDGGVPAEVVFPFKVAVSMVMPQNVIDETDADVRGVLYFTTSVDPLLNDFDTAGAIIVQNDVAADVDFDGTDITDIGNTAVAFLYAFTTNAQRGTGSANKDAPVTLQLCGLSGFETATTAFNITEVANLQVNIVAADERNYSNP
jgi:hypothetical protein